MGKLMDILKKISGKEEDEEYVPKQVIDRRLDSLRRQRQHQLNEMEREELKKQIMEYQKDFQRKHLWGIKDKIRQKKKRQLLGEIQRKKVNILKKRKSILSGNSLLDNKKEEFKKKRTNILDNHSSFLK